MDTFWQETDKKSIFN